MENDNQPSGKKTDFKEREIERMFEGIEDEIAIITASAKFNCAICKTDEKNAQANICLYRRHKETNWVIKKPYKPANGYHELNSNF